MTQITLLLVLIGYTPSQSLTDVRGSQVLNDSYETYLANHPGVDVAAIKDRMPVQVCFPLSRLPPGQVVRAGCSRAGCKNKV